MCSMLMSKQEAQFQRPHGCSKEKTCAILWQNVFITQPSHSVHPTARRQEVYSDNMAGGGETGEVRSDVCWLNMD